MAKIIPFRRRDSESDYLDFVGVERRVFSQRAYTKYIKTHCVKHGAVDFKFVKKSFDRWMRSDWMLSRIRYHISRGELDKLSERFGVSQEDLTLVHEFYQFYKL